MANTSTRFPHPITLAVDIGGTGMKVMALDARGNPLTERLRTPTPDPATPARMLTALDKLRKQLPKCDRVSVGFPGVIKQGKTLTAANLHPSWVGFPLRGTLEKRWRLPVHLANDAAVQGYGAISGRGVELVLTLGTGLGSALFTDGHLCAGLELGHHPFRKGRTYEDELGNAALKRKGARKWNRHLREALLILRDTFCYDRLYIGGGNSRHIKDSLPANTQIVSNLEGLLGGVMLWRD